jgi:hypothetical protein
MFFIKCPWCGERTPYQSKPLFLCENCEDVINGSDTLEDWEEEDGQDD